MHPGRVDRSCGQIFFKTREKLHGPGARLDGEGSPQRIGRFDAIQTGSQIRGNCIQSRLNGRKNASKIVSAAHDQFENGIYRRVAVLLGVSAPSPKVSLEKQVGAES